MSLLKTIHRCGLLLAASLVGLAMSPLSAHAAITCTITQPTALSFAYVNNTNSTTNKIQSAITAVCQRTLSTDPTSATLTLGANDGAQPVSSNNFAQLGANGVRYNLWRNSGCTQQFRDTAATQLSATFSSATLSPVTLTFDFWGCIPGQSVASFPAGLYTDVVTLTLRNGAIPLATGSIPINIYAPATCTISGLPTVITFVYSAFGAANFQSANFNANCTNLLPYTIDLSPTAGVVGGLRYDLGLSDTVGSASNVGAATLSNVGNASGTRSHVINGVMLANQAGATTPIAPQSHTLTITY